MMIAYRDVPCANMKVDQHVVVVKREDIIRTVEYFGNKFCGDWDFKNFMATQEDWG